MEHRFFNRTFRAAVGALALACTSQAPPGVASGAPSAAETYEYGGPAGTSHATRQRASDGRESLRGSTAVAIGPTHTVVEERATLDASGQLRQAEIVTHADGTPVRYRLDSSRATVRIERAGAEPVEWRVPSDAPWLYGPLSEPSGALVVTPVSIWIALRATQAARVVRVLEPERRESHLVTIDQVAVATEHGQTVALGYGADVDARFVTELRLLEDTPGLSLEVDGGPGT
jgi:hypothetical protein